MNSIPLDSSKMNYAYYSQEPGDKRLYLLVRLPLSVIIQGGQTMLEPQLTKIKYDLEAKQLADNVRSMLNEYFAGIDKLKSKAAYHAHHYGFVSKNEMTPVREYHRKKMIFYNKVLRSL